MSYSQYRYRRCGHRKNRLSSRKKTLIVALIVFTVIVCVTIFLQKNVTRILYSLSDATLRTMTVTAVNEAVAETMQGTDYDTFVTVSYGEDGSITSVEANAQKVNLYARTTATLSMAKLAEASESGIKVPLGAFTGIEFLAGFGPKVTFKIISVGSVSCRFTSSFSGAGVNQTLHSVYMVFTAEVSVVMPSGTKEIATDTEVLVAENVIVGKVPDVIFGTDLFGGGYQLSP